MIQDWPFTGLCLCFPRSRGAAALRQTPPGMAALSDAATLDKMVV